jgi:hypothetical protein
VATRFGEEEAEDAAAADTRDDEIPQGALELAGSRSVRPRDVTGFGGKGNPGEFENAGVFHRLTS